MPDANIIGIALIAVAGGAFILRAVAIRRPALRVWANIGTLALFAILAVVIGLFASSVVGAYIGGLPD